MTTDVVTLRFIPEWTFGERVRKIRRDAGLSQAEFAKRLDVGPKSVAAWETGKNKPQDIVEIAKLIRREFRVPTSWTLGTEDSGDGGGGDGGNSVRREGIEPPTRWLSRTPSQEYIRTSQKGHDQQSHPIAA